MYTLVDIIWAISKLKDWDEEHLCGAKIYKTIWQKYVLFLISSFFEDAKPASLKQ